MNEKICKILLEHRQQFVPALFTATQLGIVERYLQQKKLTNSEKTTLYSQIKRKIEALQTVREEFYVQGGEMIPERVEEAKKILKELNAEKAFISGSFLFKKEYGDIDVYVLSKKRKSYQQGNKHIMHITEINLRNPIFFSSLKYSVANFSVKEIKPIIKRPGFNELVLAYEMAISEMLDNDDQKMVRDIIFEYYLQIKKVVLDSFSLYKKFYEIREKKIKDRIELINGMMKELLLKMYSKRYLYQELGPFLKRLREGIKEYAANDSLMIYHQLLHEVKDDCRRAKD